MDKSLEKILEKIPKINEKNRHYVLGALLLGIFMFDYLLFMGPQLNGLIKISPQIDLLTRDIKQVKQDKLNVAQFQAKAAESRKKMEMLGNKILSNEEIPKILETISRLASDSAVKINQIMPLKDAQEMVLSNEDGKYYSLPILVNARGGYHAIGRFLNRVETNQIFMSIMDFDIAATNDESMQHVAKITIRAFIIDKVDILDGEAVPKGKK